MQLFPLLMTGALSGIASILAYGVAWSMLALWRPAIGDMRHTGIDIPHVFLHLFCGTGLAFLFWLSWGLAAIVDVPWWLRGLAFASLTWLALAAPVVLSFSVICRTDAPSTVAIAAQWATTCVIAGLACSWHWARLV